MRQTSKRARRSRLLMIFILVLLIARVLWGLAALAARLQKPLAAAVFIAVLLAMLHAPLYLFVPAVGLALGVTVTYVTPALVAPDEYTHLAKCYRQSSTLLGQPVADDDDMLLVRSCDAPYFKNHTGDIGIYAYKEMLEHLGDAGCSGETTVSSDTYVTADPINNTLFRGQIAGSTPARLMGLGFHGMLLLGRLCNLALYLALAAAAGNIAPQRLRGIFAGVALLAQPLQLAGSLSADAAVLDLTLATAMIGEGTDYTNLAIKDELNAEEYGVAFRKGSDAADAVNAAFDELKDDGTMQALADKYSLTLAD